MIRSVLSTFARATTALAYRHPGTELVRQIGFKALDIDIFPGLLRLRGRRALQRLHQPFGGTHRQPAVDDLACGFNLFITTERQQCTRMAHLQFAMLHQLLDSILQIQQAQQVGDGRTRSTDGLRRLFMRQLELLDQAFQRTRLFQRIQVLALDVFNQGNSNRGSVLNFPHHRRDLVQAGQLSGAPATFTGDDFVTAFGNCTYHDGLHHTLRSDGISKVLQ